MDVRVTMTEIAAGEGYNEGPELRLLVQSNKILSVPNVVASLLAEQAETFSRYQPQPSDFRPILGHHDGFRFSCEWTFPMEASA